MLELGAPERSSVALASGELAAVNEGCARMQNWLHHRHSPGIPVLVDPEIPFERTGIVLAMGERIRLQAVGLWGRDPLALGALAQSLVLGPTAHLRAAVGCGSPWQPRQGEAVECTAVAGGELVLDTGVVEGLAGSACVWVESLSAEEAPCRPI